ncbi:MAG: siroheme synthase [Caulobacteraceae bacterium]|nr:siroheme synthase [Caulobacteraceae bacterium]
MEAFPAFIPLAGARLTIAGEGELADARARLLASSPATVQRLRRDAACETASYAGVRLAFVADADRAFRAAAAAAARAAGTLVNVTDAPELSDFHVPGLIDRGPVVAAIGTAGTAPMLAALLRSELEAQIPEGLGALAGLLGEQRAAIRSAFADLGERRAFLRAVLEGPPAEAALSGDLAAARARLQAAIQAGVAAAGKVWLIEAPAARDLLSLRAARALASADILVAGQGVDEGLLALARRDASRKSLTEVDEAFLVAEAQAGRVVTVVVPAGDLEPRKAAVARLPVAHEVLPPAAGRP